MTDHAGGRVCAWQDQYGNVWREHQREYVDKFFPPGHGPIELTPLVPEQLLVEAETRHAATERNACLMAELANENKAKSDKLLAALRALADEMAHPLEGKDSYDEGFNAACDNYAKRLRALTETIPSEENT